MIDWGVIGGALDADGFARLPTLLDAAECEAIAALYDEESRFRSRIDMARYRFGVGEYQYFAAPLPARVRSLRDELYRGLAPIANRWAVRLKPDTTDDSPNGDSRTDDSATGGSTRDGSAYESSLDGFLDRCHAAGQTRPTPLLLKYTAGGYNCLHQDLYGDLAFPLQVVFALSRREVDYCGGEFLLVEQRPRAQSRGHALAIDQGTGIVFATNHRPVAGRRGDYRVVMRHGVSTVTRGVRMTLGIIFHDAR